MFGCRFCLRMKLQDVRLDDADVDAAQIEQVGDVLHRAFAHDRQDAELSPLSRTAARSLAMRM